MADSDSNRHKSLREAAEITEKTMDYVKGLEAVGMTEKELAERIDFKMKDLGAEDNAFPTIVAAAENGAEIHHEPEDRVIEAGEPVVVDLGCRYNGYCSDMTRTVVFEGDAEERFRQVFEAVREAQKRALSAAKPGVEAEEIDSAAREYLERKDLDEFFTHSTGHGVGEEVHEDPKIAPESEDVLQEGDVVTIEPGVYIEGELGVRIEDTFLVDKDSVECLTKK